MGFGIVPYVPTPPTGTHTYRVGRSTYAHSCHTRTHPGPHGRVGRRRPVRSHGPLHSHPAGVLRTPTIKITSKGVNVREGFVGMGGPTPRPTVTTSRVGSSMTSRHRRSRVETHRKTLQSRRGAHVDPHVFPRDTDPCGEVYEPGNEVRVHLIRFTWTRP